MTYPYYFEFYRFRYGIYCYLKLREQCGLVYGALNVYTHLLSKHGNKEVRYNIFWGLFRCTKQFYDLRFKIVFINWKYSNFIIKRLVIKMQISRHFIICNIDEKKCIIYSSDFIGGSLTLKRGVEWGVVGGGIRIVLK